MTKPKNLKMKVLLATGITGMIALLTGFGIFLGHTLATKFCKKIVELTGIEGEILPYVVVLGVVVLIIIFLVLIMVFVLHKRFSLFKQLGKMYGFK